MKYWGVILIVLVSMIGCGRKQIINIQDEFVPSTTNANQQSLQTVETAILSATRKRGWVARIIRPGLIEASLTVRSHRAVVEIPYTDKNYSIMYKSSENLDYSDGTIHRHYNTWVTKLSRTIQDELGVYAQKY